MADKPAEKKETAEEAPKAKKFSMQAMIIVGAMLLVEAVAICGVFMLSGGPQTVQADPLAADAAAQAEQPVELLIASDKFQNSRSGRAYIYDTEVFIVVKQKHLEAVETKKEAMQASIRTALTTIFRRAEPAQLREPELATLTRQVKAAMDERFGTDEEGEPIVQRVLIGKCTEYAPL